MHTTNSQVEYVCACGACEDTSMKVEESGCCGGACACCEEPAQEAPASAV